MLVIAGIRISGSAQFAVMTKKAERAEYTVCIDSGHGGNDPGKIGVAGTKEKEVNLTIALKLKKHLERQNIRVIMTRTDDRNLADANATNEKTSDMKNRVAKMDSEQPDAVISIHQNSFTEEKYRGAQVFYYGPSERSRELAASIQQALIEFQDPDNTRQEKANEDYYLLRKETVPTVICECGFMSNAAEEALLKSEMYQEKTAWAISVGIVRYLNGSTEKGAIEHDR